MYKSFLLFFLLILGSCDNTPVPPPNNSHPQITGDFNGDGQQETLALFVSDSSAVDISEEQLEALLMDEITWRGICRLAVADNALPPLSLGNDCMGLYWLGNEGDLDGDGSDEIAFIRDWSSSAIRDIEVYSLKNGQWKELGAAMINITMMENLSFDQLVSAKNKDTFLVMEYDGLEGEWITTELKIK